MALRTVADQFFNFSCSGWLQPWEELRVLTRTLSFRYYHCCTERARVSELGLRFPNFPHAHPSRTTWSTSRPSSALPAIMITSSSCHTVDSNNCYVQSPFDVKSSVA